MLGVLYWCAACGLGVVLWRIVGSTWFDYRMHRLQLLRRRHPGRAIYRQRPMVTVLVLVDGRGTDQLAPTLASLGASAYRKRSTVVVGFGLSRAQAALQRRQVHATGGAYHHCQQPSRDAAVILAMRRYCKGELTLVLDAGMIAHADTIERAVRHFQDNPRTTMLLPLCLPQPSYHLLGVLEWYAAVLDISQRKADSAFGVLLADQLCMVVRHGVLPLFGSGIAYDPAVRLVSPRLSLLALAQKLHTAQKLRWQLWWRLWRHLFTLERRMLWLRSALFVANSGALALLPAVVGFALYLAIALAQPQLLFLLVGAVSTVLFFVLLEAPVRRWWQKGLGAIGVPITYGAVVLAPLGCYTALVSGLRAAVASWRVLANALFPADGTIE